MTILAVFANSYAAAGAYAGWGNPANAYADDGVYATRQANEKNVTYGNLFGFDLSALPDGATNNSVTLSAEWHNSADDTNGPKLILGVKTGGSSPGNATDITGQTSDEVHTYAPTGLTAAQLKATGDLGFWAILRFYRTDNTAHIAYLDYVKITIDYSTGGAAAYALTCEPGIFELGGISAGLAAFRKLSTSAGAFALSGNAAALKAGRKLAAVAGIFNLVGNAINLTLQGAAQHLVLTASSAALSLTGGVAGLRAGRRLPISAGSYVLTGTAAGFTAARRMVAGVGAFVLTGASANLAKLVARANPTKRLIASGGSRVCKTSALPVIDSREYETPKRDNYVSTD